MKIICKYLSWLAIIFSTIIFALPSAYASPTVLFDEGHKEVFLTGKTGEFDLSRFAEILVDWGVLVRTASTSLSKEGLAGVDCLIISGPFAPLNTEEESAVIDFVEAGGKLSLMLHIPFPLDKLMFRLGVVYSNGVIREGANTIGDKMTDFSAATNGEHPLVKGVKRIGLYGAWGVVGNSGTVHELAGTSSHAWVDLNKDGVLSQGDAMQQLGVVVAGTLGKGEFVVFGDDAIFQNRFLHNENEKLANNLAQWIVQKRER